MRFDECATSYEREAHIQRAVASWCAEWLEPDLRGLRAIEFGAGPGVFTRELVQRHSDQLLATDISLPMIVQGKKNLPDIEWSTANAWAPPDVHVDRIYSTSLLQWAPDPLKVFQHWRQLLQNRGRLLVSVFIEGSMLELAKSGSALMPFSWLPEQTWLAACAASDFQVERWEILEKKLFFSTAAQALRSVHRVGACKNGICSPASLKSSLRDYESTFRTAQGVPISWRALRLEATVPGRQQKQCS